VARRREHPAAARERRAAVDDPELILAAALRFLEARSRSVSEVRRRLTGAGYQADLVEGAITRLVDLGMLDDAAFGAAWLESRDRARPRGERALRQELRLKGLDGTLVDELLGERAAAGDDVDRVAAERVLSRHRAALARVADPRVRRHRAYALLARNGFDPETCSAAVRAFLAEDGAADT
jgi:regulatory protein